LPRRISQKSAKEAKRCKEEVAGVFAEEVARQNPETQLPMRRKNWLVEMGTVALLVAPLVVRE
jgi:hypothetical protein